MLISVITINLNNLSGLQKTVHSVINQSFDNFEYIIIDGASVDGSKDYIFSQKKYLSYCVSEPDRGIYAAMNKGIMKATGEYVLFLNSGDWLAEDDLLKRIAPYLTTVDLLYGNYIRYYSEGNQIVYKGIGGEEIGLFTFFTGNSLPHTATFHRRSLFKTVGKYDENLNIVSDWKFFLEAIIFRRVSVKYIDLSISFFDMNGISNTSRAKKEREQKTVLASLFTQKVYRDLVEISNKKDFINSNRFKMLNELEGAPLAKKLLSIILRVMLYLFRGKRLQDL